MPNNESKILWMSMVDNSVKVETTDEARKLAEEYPDEAKYKTWIQVLIVGK